MIPGRCLSLSVWPSGIPSGLVFEVCLFYRLRFFRFPRPFGPRRTSFIFSNCPFTLSQSPERCRFPLEIFRRLLALLTSWDPINLLLTGTLAMLLTKLPFFAPLMEGWEPAEAIPVSKLLRFSPRGHQETAFITSEFSSHDIRNLRSPVFSFPLAPLI